MSVQDRGSVIISAYVQLEHRLRQKAKESLYEAKDVRSSIYHFIGVDLVAVLIMMRLTDAITKGVFQPDMLGKIFGIKLVNDHQSIEQKLSWVGGILNQYIRHTIQINTQFLIENYFKTLLFNIENKTPPEGFRDLIKNLFKKLTIQNMNQKIELFEVFAFIRNTLHSNGVHTKRSRIIMIDDRKFEFIQGKQIENAHFLDLHFLINKIIDVIEEINQTPEVSKFSFISSSLDQDVL